MIKRLMEMMRPVKREMVFHPGLRYSQVVQSWHM